MSETAEPQTESTEKALQQIIPRLPESAVIATRIKALQQEIRELRAVLRARGVKSE
jgi:hypothetical protein